MTAELPLVSPHELVVLVNDMVAREIESVAPTEWDENHISFSLVRALRDALSLSGQAAPRAPCRLMPVNTLKAQPTFWSFWLPIKPLGTKVSACV